MISGPYEFPDDADLNPLWPHFIKRRNRLAEYAQTRPLTAAEVREIELHKQGLPYTFLGCTYMGRPIQVVRYFIGGLGYDTAWYLLNNPANWPNGLSIQPGVLGSLPTGWRPLTRGVDYPNDPPFRSILEQLHALPEPFDVQVSRVVNGEYGGLGH